MPADTATPPSAAPAPAAAGDRAGGRARELLGRWETLLVGLLVVTAVVGAALSGEFLTADSFTTGSLDFSEVALMALALTLVIIAAEIDLSVASVLRSRAPLMASLWNRGLPLELIMPICLVAGAAVRRLQRRARDAPRPAVARGDDRHARAVPRARLRGHRRRVGDGLPGRPGPTAASATSPARSSPTRWCCSRSSPSRSASLLHATPFGRSIYAIGANEEAAYFSGLRVKRIKLTLFVAVGHGRRARRHRDLAAQLDRGGERRPGVRADRHHRRAARRRVDLRRPRDDRSASSSRCSCSAPSRRRCC